MFVELLHVTTADMLTLHGALYSPATESEALSDNARAIDAVLLLHGVGGNFYNSALLTRIAQQLAAAQVSTLQANTRGHDFVSIVHTSMGPRRYGAAYESVDACRHDIAAWIDRLVALGNRNIAIVGHSLGAIKALYAAAYQPHRAVRRIVAISPPCLSFTRFQNGPRAKLFAKYLARAQACVEQGTPLALVRVKYPFPLLITAASYLDKYGPAERYNILRFASRVPCPTLYLYGQRELDSGSVAFANLPEQLDAVTTAAGKRPQCQVVPGADHVYSGHEDIVAQRVVPWLLTAEE